MECPPCSYDYIFRRNPALKYSQSGIVNHKNETKIVS